MVLLLFAQFRAGFEPLSWRRDHGHSLRNEYRSFSRAASQPTPRLKTGADWRGIGTEPWARRVLRPTVSGFSRRVALSPFRPFAESPSRRVAVSPPSLFRTSAAKCLDLFLKPVDLSRKSTMELLALDLNLPEMRLGEVLIPWVAVVGILGFLAGWLIIAIMERTGLSRYVWHLPLFFLALVVLLSSLIGMVFQP